MCSIKKVVARNFAIILGKYLYRSFFLLKFQSLGQLIVLLNRIVHAVLH